MSAGDGARDDTSERVRDLTLLLLYLTRWTETPRGKLPPGFEVAWRAWKGYDWDALDRLKEESRFDFNYLENGVIRRSHGQLTTKQVSL